MIKINTDVMETLAAKNLSILDVRELVDSHMADLEQKLDDAHQRLYDARQKAIAKVNASFDQEIHAIENEMKLLYALVE